ncbi:Heat shock protein 70 family [Cynara cardunculus var. scolymus]|uniref:Heat shock protein 70 family n=1 Tax=Cynara cardunculus var. scolymus TaxID=59895 RepID=A0A103XCI5_CYNCS|nr:Heat shock protein 70 family [Cynara cardunculus var. scolymus]
MDKASIDEVVLVGGSTRIPKRIIPDEAVAYGAGYLAANLSDLGDEVVRGLKLIDVTSLSLGGLSRRETQKFRELFFWDNLVSLVFLLLPGGGVEIKIRYDIDDNGILHVSARELTTGRNKANKITDDGSLSRAEISKMIKDAERYKQEDEAHIKKAMAHKALNDYAYRWRVNLNRYKISYFFASVRPAAVIPRHRTTNSSITQLLPRHSCSASTAVAVFRLAASSYSKQQGTGTVSLRVPCPDSRHQPAVFRLTADSTSSCRNSPRLSFSPANSSCRNSPTAACFPPLGLPTATPDSGSAVLFLRLR